MNYNLLIGFYPELDSANGILWLFTGDSGHVCVVFHAFMFVRFHVWLQEWCDHCDISDPSFLLEEGTRNPVLSFLDIPSVHTSLYSSVHSVIYWEFVSFVLALF